MRNWEAWDRIELKDMDEASDLVDWVRENGHLSCQAVLEKGTIRFLIDTDYVQIIIFKVDHEQDSVALRLGYYQPDNDSFYLLLKFQWFRERNTVQNEVWNNEHISLELKRKLKDNYGIESDDDTRIHFENLTAATFIGCMHMMENPKLVESERTTGHRGSKRSGKQRKTRPMRYTTYRFKDRPERSSTVNRHTQNWSVRGHWRQLRSGKKTWVRPYQKGKAAQAVYTQ